MEDWPSELLKKLDLNIKGVLSTLSVNTRQEQRIVDVLRRDLSSLRLYVSDFQNAEHAKDSLKASRMAVKLLASVRQAIMSGSEHDMFGAVDVAHLTAQIEQLESKLIPIGE